MTADWKQAETKLELNDARPKLYERPLQKVVLKKRINAKLKTQGLFIGTADPNNTTGWLIQSDFLSYRKPESLYTNTSELDLEALDSLSILSLEPICFKDATGIYLVYDLGREESGLFDLELEGECGTVIDIAYGEHLEDLRVRAEVGGRNFAFTYYCSQGKQTFTHYFKRMAGRYSASHSRCQREFRTVLCGDETCGVSDRCKHNYRLLRYCLIMKNSIKFEKSSP